MRALAAICAAAALLLCAGTATAATGHSPDCKRFCMSVEPRSGPEGSVFVFRGRRWRPERRVRVWFGPYCRPDAACPAIAYLAWLRTNERGRFVFRLRAGESEPGDRRRRIASGARPSFRQRARNGRIVRRAPRYEITVTSETTRAR